MQENIQTQGKVAAEFKKDLAALLKKYSIEGWKAEISLKEDSFAWHSEYSVEVCIPSVYGADGNLIREYTEIDLGRNFAP